MTSRDDEAWREIVENFGDMPEIEDPVAPAERIAIPRPEDDPDAWHPQPWEDEGRFVPPPPPPVPRAEPKRQAAWLGLFLAPTILLVALVFAVNLPSMLDVLLVCWFAGGFIYLVATMPSGPRDPDDNGARL